MTTSTPLDTADDLFLRLGSQSYFRAPLHDALGHTSGTPTTTQSDAADDVLLRLGDQPLFRSTLQKPGTPNAGGVSSGASADLSDANRSLTPLI